MSTTLSWLVAWDVAQARRGARIRRALLPYATGGQKSVRECRFSPAEFSQAHAALLSALDRQADRLLLIRLDPRAARYDLGRATAAPATNFLYWS